MSLYSNPSYASPGNALFATKTSGGIVTEPSYVATGTGSPPNGGFFQAISQDFTGNGTAGFALTDVNGIPRWTIGTNGIETGANSGDNFALTAYSDTGVALTAPLTINRASGGVQMQNGLTVGNTLITTGALVADSAVIGDNTVVGGGVVQVNGPAGLSRVYDPVYNPPLAGAEFIMTTTDNLLTQTVVANVTPTRSGPYVFTMEVKASATGLAFTNGTAFINAYLLTGGPLGYITDSYLCCDFVADPDGYNTPGGTIPPNTYVKDSVAIVNLQAGVTYSAGVTGTPGINLGQSGVVLGGIRCFIQPLLA